MGIASSCDRCGALYKNDTSSIDHQVQKKSKTQDLCPDCAYKLETWFEHPELDKDKKTKVKREHNMTEETRNKMSDRMEKVTENARKIMEEEDCSWAEAVSKASKQLKEFEENPPKPMAGEQPPKPNLKNTVEQKKLREIEELADKLQKKNKLSRKEALELARETIEEDNPVNKPLPFIVQSTKKRDRHSFDSDYSED